MSQGTPKTLNQAISNAFQQYKKERITSEQRLRKILKMHLKDFINNKIGPAYLNADDDMIKDLDRFMKTVK